MSEKHLSNNEVRNYVCEKQQSLTNIALSPVLPQAVAALRVIQPRLHIPDPKTQYESPRLPQTISKCSSETVLLGADVKTEDAETTPSQLFPDLNLSHPLPLIIRATNGKSKDKREKKIKLSTVVEADALEGFFAKYAEVCKTGMSGLKKRDRSKAKERLKAKKRKQGGVGAVGTVPGAIEIKKEKA